MQAVYTDKNNIALRKGKIVSVYTNLGANSPDYTLSVSGTGYAANQRLVEVLSCSNVTVGADGILGVGMSQGLPRVSLYSLVRERRVYEADWSICRYFTP